MVAGQIHDCIDVYLGPAVVGQRARMLARGSRCGSIIMMYFAWQHTTCTGRVRMHGIAGHNVSMRTLTRGVANHGVGYLDIAGGNISIG